MEAKELSTWTPNENKGIINLDSKDKEITDQLETDHQVASWTTKKEMAPYLEHFEGNWSLV